MSPKPEFNYLREQSETALKEATRLKERAKYFTEKEDYTQALDNYADSLISLAESFKKRGEWITIHQPLDMNKLPQPTAEFNSQALFPLFAYLDDIAICYQKNNEPVKEAFFRQKLLLIATELAKYEKYFTREQLESYDVVRRKTERNKLFVGQHQEAIEELKKSNKDQLFNKFRKALQDISSTESCPITLDSSCFIATAVYMTAKHPDLDTFRAFRDQKLLVNPLGKLLVSIYYKVGPNLALYIGNQPILKEFTHQKLIKLANWMRKVKVVS